MMRPNECMAKQCSMSNGRNYCYDENNEYLLILCVCCGSNGVHKCCLDGTKDFICKDCGPALLPTPKPPAPAKKRRRLNETIGIDTLNSEPQPSKKRRKITKSIDKTDLNNNAQINSPTEQINIKVKSSSC